MEFLAEFRQLDLGALFLLGLLGSGHCVGMCGPLILAFPGRQERLSGHLAYNSGRILSYSLVGLLLGGLGQGLALLAGEASLLWTLRVQLLLSLLAALFLALFGLSKLGFLKEPKLLSSASPGRLPGFQSLQRRLSASQATQRGAMIPLLFIGVLLGLLPCGLSFAAFAKALGAGGALRGALMGLSFGLGTLPSLLLLGLSASRLSLQHRQLSDLIAGMLMIGMAAALLLEINGAL